LNRSDNHLQAMREAFADQAVHCDALGSPFTARLCRLIGARLDPASPVGRHIVNWQGDFRSGADNVPLRLCGALNYLVLADKDNALADVYPQRQPGGEPNDTVLWATLEKALEASSDAIIRFLASPPQTNEVRRSVALLPAYHQIARRYGLPLAIRELGASAGLNLHAHRFAVKTDEGLIGHRETPLTLQPDWRGENPPQSDNLQISDASGCDLLPVDLTDPEQRLRLMAYIWPDQTDRVQRTQQAIRIALANPDHRVEREDAIDWLEKQLDTNVAGRVLVIQHTIAWQYFPDILKRKGEALLARYGVKAESTAPIARISMEADSKGDGAALALTLWPDGQTHDLGRVDFHGRWINWHNPRLQHQV
jgi:hypothetical protein